MTTLRDNLDGVVIDTDENGFHIWLSGELHEYHFMMPTTIALELMRAVKREIEPWAAEGGLVQQIARDEMEAGR